MVNDMTDLFERLADAKSYATRENAQRKLDKFAGAIPDACTTFVAQRPDGRWIAVVIYSERVVMNIPMLCHNGICVTS